MIPPIIELRAVSKHFGPTHDAASRFTRSLRARFGSPQPDQTVRAVAAGHYSACHLNG